MRTEAKVNNVEDRYEATFFRRYLQDYLPWEYLAKIGSNGQLAALIEGVKKWLGTDNRANQIQDDETGRLVQALRTLHKNSFGTSVGGFLTCYKKDVLPELFPIPEFQEAFTNRYRGIERYLQKGASVGDLAGLLSQADAEYVVQLLKLGGFDSEANLLNLALQNYLLKRPPRALDPFSLLSGNKTSA
ncbi:MAG: hypothetical protein V1838_05070 [Patescibacteria group bacterium]